MLSDESRKRTGELTIPEDVDGISDELLLSAVGELETPSLEKEEAKLLLVTGSPGYFLSTGLIYLFNIIYSQLSEQCYFNLVDNIHINDVTFIYLFMDELINCN